MMSNEDLKIEITEAVKTILINILNVTTNRLELDLDTNPFELGLDSMSIIDFILAIEDEFAVSFDEAELSEETFQSIRAIVDNIFEKKVS